jgi:hypothetical protein
MRNPDQTPEALQLDIHHLNRVRSRAAKNTVRNPKTNKILIEALNNAIAIITVDAFPNSKTNGSRA